MNPREPGYKHKSNNFVPPFRKQEARHAEDYQARRQTPEPRQRLDILSRNEAVHTPETGDDVHGQDDGADDGKFAQDVVGLLRALVHADVDLGEIV